MTLMGDHAYKAEIGSVSPRESSVSVDSCCKLGPCVDVLRAILSASISAIWLCPSDTISASAKRGTGEG